MAWAAFAACLLSASPVGSAQSLQTLYETARAYDAVYLGAQALADSARYRADQVHALRRPSLGLTATVARALSDAPVANTRNRAATAALTAVQSLFNRADDATIAQADRSIEAAQADLELAEQDLIVRVAQTYFDVLGAQDTLETTRSGKRAIAQQRSAARRNYEVGTATITDVREAQARYDLATAQDIGADNDLATKRIALDELIGSRGIEPWRLSTPVRLPALTPNSVAEWVADTDTSPTVRRAATLSDLAKLETEKVRAQHLPTVELQGSYSVGTGRLLGSQALSSSGQSLGGALPIDVAGRTMNASVNVLLRVPLFSGFAVQDRIQETLRLEDQARYGLEAARRTTAQATRQAFFGVQSLMSQATALEAAESSSQSALDATLLGYRVGVRVNIDVLNAQSQLYGTQRDLAQARYGVLFNRLKLRQAAGTLTAGDLATVTQLTTPLVMARASEADTIELLAAGLIQRRPGAAAATEPRPVPQQPAPSTAVPAAASGPARAATLDPQRAEDLAKSFLARWTDAWSRRDMAGYVAMYEPDFAGRSGTHDRWIAFRSGRIEGRQRIEVAASSVRVTARPGAMVLQFDQTYRGDAWVESGRKQMVLKHTSNGWLIHEETTLR